MSSYDELIGHVVQGIETTGAAIMTIGGVVVLARYASAVLRHQADERSYTTLRSDLGRVILVGLEVLIIADIVRTIIVTATIESVLALGLIVIIRTVLSFSLEVEIDGAWPWQHGTSPAKAANLTPGASDE